MQETSSRSPSVHKKLADSQGSETLSFGSFQDPEVSPEARPFSSRPASRNSVQARPSQETSLQPDFSTLNLSPDEPAEKAYPSGLPSQRQTPPEKEATSKERSAVEASIAEPSPNEPPIPQRIISSSSLKSETQADDRIQQELLSFFGGSGS